MPGSRDDIRNKGLRATASRVAVLEQLREAARPLCHADVVEAIGEEQWDRATLYRNLIDLTEVGLLRRVSLGSTWHFEEADDERHAHFVCTECGVVECTPETTVAVNSHSPKSARKGNVEVQLHGVCDDCD